MTHEYMSSFLKYQQSLYHSELLGEKIYFHFTRHRSHFYLLQESAHSKEVGTHLNWTVENLNAVAFSDESIFHVLSRMGVGGDLHQDQVMDL